MTTANIFEMMTANLEKTTSSPISFRPTTALLAWGFIVIIWGAWVRISHSGDGCGASWPLCEGQWIPGVVPQKTWIEWTHRALSGIFGIAVFAVWIYSLRTKPRTSRILATFALFFTITEALLGAKLVLSSLVGTNASAARLVFMALHLMNSLLLMGSLYLLDLEQIPFGVPFGARLRFGTQRVPKRSLAPNGIAPILFLLVAITGTWAALANTLFPASGFFQALRDDFSPVGVDVPLLVQLRVWHPLLASIFGVGFGFYFVEKGAKLVASVFFLATFAGALNILLQAPVLLKLLHLSLVYLVWFCLLGGLWKKRLP